MFQYTPRSLRHLVELQCIIYFSHFLLNFFPTETICLDVTERPFFPINCYISSRWYILPSCEISYGYNAISVFAQTVRFCPFGIFYLNATFFLSVTIDPHCTSGMQWEFRLFIRLNFQIVEKIFSQSTRAEWNDFCFFKIINWRYNISNCIRKIKQLYMYDFIYKGLHVHIFAEVGTTDRTSYILNVLD